MKKILIICLLFTLFVPLSAQVCLTNKNVKLNIMNDGVIHSLSMNNLSANAEPIQFRADSLNGPTLLFNGRTLWNCHIYLISDLQEIVRI